MAEFEWLQRARRHFGTVWTPVARVHLVDVAGRWRGFVAQVDTCAVVSLLRRSVADVLGLQFDRGRRVDMAGVGSGVTIAFVHQLRLRIASGLEIVTEFAIAEHEDVPNLLGRVGIFDRLRIEFDPTKHVTRILKP